ALSSVDNSDVDKVGGKNASLGEMIQRMGEVGVRVPGGFATTSHAYWQLIEGAGLRPKLEQALVQLSSDDKALEQTGARIRKLIGGAHLPDDLDRAIRNAYRELASSVSEQQPAVAVRSSATAEDLPEASFAGQQESFLNVRGEDKLINACHRCYASLFTN